MELLQGLAVFGIIMMVLIAIALQHVAQIMARSMDSDDNAPLFVLVVFIISIFILYVSFYYAVELF